MQQKITVNLAVNTERCRQMAMNIAVSIAGVISVDVDRDKNEMEVVGVGVDSYALMKCLKKKFKCARILSIQEVKPPVIDDPPIKTPSPPHYCCDPCGGGGGVQYYPICQPVYDYNPPASCSVM
ncbi:PREDICTED: heavy metal-associated isoprenylated plant protein 47-like [Ipomoea nil]|uniref:heavy metal-associated isoprenylated plant protein 47-like n=1 Tax=Ipomoea nil TaxID=35883 RepID=UPI000900CB64|nr:PREDICTED: heavy metal-associated isoprenylated plant protein 47-like [Ipomoea nil]